MGRLVWNTSKFVKVPGTNKRVRRARPENEWRIVHREDLRIIDQELWQQVRDRLTRLKNLYAGQRKPGLLQRSATSSYLFSGLLKCGQCGGNLVIVTRNGPGGQYRKYGCSQHFYRGACPNNLLERQDWLEKRLLSELQDEVLKPEAIEYVIAEFGRQLKGALEGVHGEAAPYGWDEKVDPRSDRVKLWIWETANRVRCYSIHRFHCAILFRQGWVALRGITTA
jgi:hypothetical protein